MNWLRRNLALKIISLVLAYVAWVYVVSRSPGVRFVNAPVEVDAPEGVAIVDYDPREVRVRLEGDAPLINRLSEQNVYVRARIEGSLRPGRHRVTILERDVLGLPPGVARELLTPAINVSVQRRVSRKVPVRVRIAGFAPEGYRVLSSTADPASVEISGPEDALRAIDQVWTEPVDPRRSQRSFTERAEIVRPDPLATIRPDIVTVTVSIDEVAAPLELQLPVSSLLPGFEADPPRVRVVVEGPPSLLTRVGERITAFVGGDAGTRGGTVPVRLDFSGISADDQARLRVTVVDPARVRLRRPAGN